MIKNYFSTRLFLFSAACLCMFVAACGTQDKMEISQLLDARDQAIAAQSLAGYSQLLAANYHDGKRKKIDAVAQMIGLFDQFDEMKMTSFNREIRVLDDSHAECLQSYKLKVRSDDHWQEMVQREQITLQRFSDGWKITGGL